MPCAQPTKFADEYVDIDRVARGRDSDDSELSEEEVGSGQM